MKMNAGMIIGLAGGVIGGAIGVASVFAVNIYAGIGMACIMTAVFYLFYRVFVKPAREHSRLMKYGKPATGTILSVHETGTRINNQPLVRLRLQVSLDGRPPYEVETRTVISYFQASLVQPGNALSLMVDPNDQTKVTVVREGEITNNNNPLVNASPQAIEDLKAQLETMQKEHDEIKAEGIYCRAIVTKYTPLGININGNNPLVALEVQVLPEKEPAFAATVKGVVAEVSVAKFQPGEEIFVKYDPNDKTRVAIEHS